MQLHTQMSRCSMQQVHVASTRRRRRGRRRNRCPTLIDACSKPAAIRPVEHILSRNTNKFSSLKTRVSCVGPLTSRRHCTVSSVLHRATVHCRTYRSVTCHYIFACLLCLIVGRSSRGEVPRLQICQKHRTCTAPCPLTRTPTFVDMTVCTAGCKCGPYT